MTATFTGGGATRTASLAIEHEAAEDVFFGQVVMIWARWFLIAAGSVFFLWTAHESTQLALGVLPIAALMAVNFRLHGRYVLERPSNALQIALAGALDLALISTMVVLWHAGTAIGTGFASPFFVLYYPVLLAFAFVMPRLVTVLFTALCMAIYAAICVADVHSVAEAKVLLLRLVVMAAMGGLGTFYWRVQRDRRRDAAGVA